MYDELVALLKVCPDYNEGCKNCPHEHEFGCQNTVMREAADVIDKLTVELEKYRRAAFAIGEICVEESKCHISTNDCIQKIRERIYYSRQMPPRSLSEEDEP